MGPVEGKGAAGELGVWLSAWQCGWGEEAGLWGSEFGPQKVFWT